MFGKIKKEEFARRSFKKNSVFSRLKLLNKHFSQITFFSLISVLPVVYCGSGKILPTLKPNSRSWLEPQTMLPFSWGVKGKIIWENSSWSKFFSTTYAEQRTKYNARIKYSACWIRHQKKILRIQVKHWIYNKMFRNASAYIIFKKEIQIFFCLWVTS